MGGISHQLDGIAHCKIDNPRFRVEESFRSERSFVHNKEAAVLCKQCGGVVVATP